MKIASLKYRIPEKRLSNDDVIEHVRTVTPNLTSEEFELLAKRIKIGFRLSGSQYRYQFMQSTHVMDYLVDAAREAIDAADLALAEISLIIYVGIGRGCMEPASAALLQKRLGALNASALDLMDACVSWVRGLEVGQALMKCGAYRNVLLVNCEMGMHHIGMIDGLTPGNLDLYFSGLTMGEAATAAVLLPQGDDFVFHCRTFPEGFGYCMTPMQNAASFLGSELPQKAVPDKFYVLSTKLVTTGLQAIETVYRDAGYDKIDPPQLTFVHAVSEKASRACMQNLDLQWDRHFDIHATHGNCVSASIPLAIALAMQVGRLETGTDVMIIGGGAGISVALCRFTAT